MRPPIWRQSPACCTPVDLEGFVPTPFVAFPFAPTLSLRGILKKGTPEESIGAKCRDYFAAMAGTDVLSGPRSGRHDAEMLSFRRSRFFWPSASMIELLPVAECFHVPFSLLAVFLPFFGR